MSDQHPGAPAQPPPAWYPDPASPQHVRWWDGAAWTGHVNAAQPPRPGLGRGWFTLAGFLQLALALCVPWRSEESPER